MIFIDLCHTSQSTHNQYTTIQQQSGSNRSYSKQVDFIHLHTLTSAIMSHIFSSNLSICKPQQHEMGSEFGHLAIQSTSSILSTSILLYTYRHFTQRRLPCNARINVSKLLCFEVLMMLLNVLMMFYLCFVQLLPTHSHGCCTIVYCEVKGFSRQK